MEMNDWLIYVYNLGGQTAPIYTRCHGLIFPVALSFAAVSVGCTPILVTVQFLQTHCLRTRCQSRSEYSA